MTKRDVFYIAGYDPKSYRHYYALFKKNLNIYKKNFALDAALSKSDASEDFPFWRIETPTARTKYTFLAWNDIVRKNWSESYKDALIDCYDLFRIYTITGLFIKFGKESIYQLITGFYPFFYVLFSLLFSLGLGALVFAFLNDFIHLSIALIFGLLLAFFVNKFLFLHGKKLAVFWIARICAFCGTWRAKKQGELEERMQIFSRKIADTLKERQNEADYELVLIAHSVGCVLCIEVLAGLLRICAQEGIDTSRLKILTLGECIPLVSYQKKEVEFRKNLEFIAGFDLKWYDFTSIIDGACFPQVDFIKTSGVIGRFGPKFYSAKFYTLYEKEHYKKIKWDKNRAHFLYLMSNELKGTYDFFNFVILENFLEEKIKDEDG